MLPALLFCNLVCKLKLILDRKNEVVLVDIHSAGWAGCGILGFGAPADHHLRTKGVWAPAGHQRMACQEHDGIDKCCRKIH
mmetsp:Transcript_77744/g.142291  ORF Transcript_77744/g.142291 Transcript_77744/m.142291 type:complete len:81 (-) Transcript_77744:46-288(-)